MFLQRSVLRGEALQEHIWPSSLKTDGTLFLVQVLADGTSASTVYGVQHLLRLCVRLPELVPWHTLSEENAAALLARVQDFVTYLHRNHEKLWSM